jgi:hypothetical protein
MNSDGTEEAPEELSNGPQFTVTFVPVGLSFGQCTDPHGGLP